MFTELCIAFNVLQEYIGAAGWWHASSSDRHSRGAPSY